MILHISIAIFVHDFSGKTLRVKSHWNNCNGSRKKGAILKLLHSYSISFVLTLLLFDHSLPSKWPFNTIQMVLNDGWAIPADNNILWWVHLHSEHIQFCVHSCVQFLLNLCFWWLWMVSHISGKCYWVYSRGLVYTFDLIWLFVGFQSQIWGMWVTVHGGSVPWGMRSFI